MKSKNLNNYKMSEDCPLAFFLLSIDTKYIFLLSYTHNNSVRYNTKGNEGIR